ncbi:flagellar hook-associated protein FlgK [Aeromonas aquatica]|uniref:flagellar hook-associated protein FlgK n=1 Tax=Aeromonas aquatica TaxID=558964 RepID=UPI000FBD6C61|nr:flagellar hook-associated protein FlgK [Aeromonas aquatica]
MDMMQIGMSGLQASQAWLNVTASNIANVSTPGFSRQTLVVTSNADGTVSVDGMQRMSDQYLVSQTWGAATDVGYAGTYASSMLALENVFSTDGGNLGMGLDGYFAALHACMADPGNPSTREDVLNATRQLTGQINNINNTLDGQIDQINKSMAAMADEVNSLTKQIADLNMAIQEGTSQGQDVSALLDARDMAVLELSELIDVSVVDCGDGTIQVTLPQGQPLVMQGESATLGFTPGTSPSDGKLEMKFGDEVYYLNPDIGGALGAAYEYYHEELIPACEYVDEFAQEFADAMNSWQVVGYDLNGNPGKPMFTYDPADPAGTLQLAEGFTNADLAFASAPGSAGDNGNLQNMINVQNQTFVFDSLGGGSFSLNDSYNAVYSHIATASASAREAYEMSLNVMEQAAYEWMGVSSVNLDEEAMHLLEYQQNYVANAQVIATSDELFSTVMGMF